jgi:hypothetical protein
MQPASLEYSEKDTLSASEDRLCARRRFGREAEDGPP